MQINDLRRYIKQKFLNYCKKFIYNYITNKVILMPKAHVNDIEIEYDTFGDPSSKPLLLIMGLGAQMIVWLEVLCNYVANQGFFVIRFDNRDVGLSTKFEEKGVPDWKELITNLFIPVEPGKETDPPYTLEDMADDAIGVLDELNIDKAHIWGASMGGMIAQIVAYRHPDRILSLASIMSTTSNPDVKRASQELLEELFSPYPTEREAYIKESVRRGRLTYGTYPYNEEQTRDLAAAAYDRCFSPDGTMRQLAAIVANGNRKPELASIKVPTIVVHGKEDPLAPVECGIDTALDTCGYVRWEVLEKILEYTDLVLFDIKHMELGRHQELTAVSNKLILDNVIRIVQRGTPIIVRIPLIPAYTDSMENIKAVGDFLSKLGLVRVDLVPYHQLGKSKYKRMGKKYKLEELNPPSESEVRAIQEILESYKAEVTIA